MTLSNPGLAGLILAFFGLLWRVGRRMKQLAPILLLFACAGREVSPPPEPVTLPGPEAIAGAAAEASRLAVALNPPSSRGLSAAADTPLIDWNWLRNERTTQWRKFLADVQGAEFQAPELAGCVRGWKASFGGGTAYGVSGRLLDWALTLSSDSPDRARAMAWVRSHVLHVMRYETWWGADDGLPRVSGEAGPAAHVDPLPVDPIERDTDLLRHWCLEPYARAVLERAVPFTDAEREDARRFVLGWGLQLRSRTPVATMSVTNVFYEGAHSRFWFTIDNLTWAYLASGEKKLLEHAENLVVSSLGWTRRGPGTPFPAPFQVWAGSDPWECGRALGNPNAPHRASSCWHDGDAGRRALPFYIVTQRADARSLARDFVLLQTEIALRDGNPILRGGELRLSGTPKIAAEGDAAPWALKNPKDALLIPVSAKYQVLAGVPNWVWDADYHSTVLPNGAKRYRYTNTLGVMVDASNSFGWADLWWARFLLTGDETDRLRALVCMRDHLWWRNAAGPYVLVTVNGRTGFPYGGGNIGRARTFAWAVECASLLPMDASAEAAIASLR